MSIRSSVSKIIDLVVNKGVSPHKYPVAAFIVNYNMPERAEALYDKLSQNTKWPLDIYLIDNGSDIKPLASKTNVVIKNNVQTTQGWLRGIAEAKKTKKKYFAYMFFITSTEIVSEKDIVTPMVTYLIKNRDAVGIHPSLTKDSTTNWTHLINRGTNKVRPTWMIDNLASMYRADWFDKIGQFDSKLIYAWGIDLETCYLARKAGKTIWVDDTIEVKKVTNIAYKMNRMNMTADTRSKLAAENMSQILSSRYGKDYWDVITKDFVKEEML